MVNPKDNFIIETRGRKELSNKTYWVTYGLQGLSTEKFLRVVKKILEGEYILLKPPEPDTQTTEEDF